MGELYRRLRGSAVKEWMTFRTKWRAVGMDAARIRLAIAEDQLNAWAYRADSRRRNQALKGWGDMLRSFA